MSCTAKLNLVVENPATSAAAIAPDDPGSIEVDVGTTLKISAKSDTPMGLLRTLDDVLGCLRVTEA